MEAASLRLCQLHQLFREAGEPSQGGFNVASALACGTIGRFDDQSLCLCQRGRHRRAQFMRGVGGKAALGLQGAPAHGLGVSPDGKTLWSTSKVYSHAYVFSLPDIKPIGTVFVGQHPEWVTFTPGRAGLVRAVR